VFKAYKDTLDALEQDYPDTHFIHFTVPLTPVKETIKTWIKKIMRRSCWELSDNISRMQYNKLVRRAYAQHNLFDIAQVESNTESRSQSGFTYHGSYYQAMNKDIAERDGHLNATGKIYMAEKLTGFLCQV
jgi:hypothetical protein